MGLPSDHDAITAAIAGIGRELVACSSQCEGIDRDQAVGSLPRCLIFETAARSSEQGCAIVGINPGRASRQERQFYLQNACAYDAVVEWFGTGLRHPYYVRLRRFVDQIGLTGPILWTEIAKCENVRGRSGLPPLSTLRDCAGRFLTRELAAVPATWPIIGVGAEAFKALAYLYPHRAVIGLPHPTGAYGHFPRLFSGRDLLPQVRSAVTDLLASDPPKVLRLDASVLT